MDVFDKITEKLLGKTTEKPENAADQSGDEKQLVSYVDQKLDESRLHGSRISNEGIWMTNVAYLCGYDQVFWDAQTRQYRPLGGGNKFIRKSRMHVNKILPRAQNRLARLCKNAPKYDVRPNSNNPDDKDAARLGIEVITNIWDRQYVNKKRLDLMMWVQQCGYAFIKTSWDPTLGKPMIDPLTGEADGYEGDVKIEVVSPFEIYTDPLAKSMEEVKWLIHARIKKLDYFRENYEKGYLVKEEGNQLSSLQYEARINAMNTTGATAANISSQMKNAAVEKAYYEAPTSKHPNGRLIVTANGVLLEDKELACGEIPFAKFDDVLIGGKFASESVITHARPIQDQHSRLITKRAEWTNRLLAGKFMAPRGHGINSEAFNDQSGEIIEWNQVPGAPNNGSPIPVPLPVIPSYAYEEETRLDAMLDDIFGINEISRGVLPAAGIPAVGMSFLQEQDETRIGVVTESNEYSWTVVASQILKYVGKYYVMPRLLKIAGNSQEYAVKEFTGKDLRDNYDVICIRGSTVPGSKTIKRQDILNALQLGLLGDPNDPKVRMKVLRMMEYGDIAEAWEDQALDERQIKQSIEMIEKGFVPEQSEFDNHEMHFLFKNRYRKSDKFQELPPMSQQILLQDLEYHIQSLMNIQNPTLQTDKMMADEMAQAAMNHSPEQMQTLNPDEMKPVPPEVAQETGVA